MGDAFHFSSCWDFLDRCCACAAQSLVPALLLVSLMGFIDMQYRKRPLAGKILSGVSVMLWLVWPAVFSAVFRAAPNDFVGDALKAFFFYPPSLSNVTGHWLNGESAFKAIYLSAWYVNTLLISVCYSIFLITRSEYMTESLKRDSVWRMLGLGVACLVMTVLMYSGLVFSTTSSLPKFAKLLLGTDPGFWVGLPLIYTWTACAPVAAVFCFVVVWRKLFFKTKEDLR